MHSYIDLVTRGYVEEGETTHLYIISESKASRLMESHGREHFGHHAAEVEQLKSIKLPEHMLNSEIVEIFR